MSIAEGFWVIGSVPGHKFFWGLGKFNGIFRFLSCLILSALFSVRPAMPHPVSQGAMDIVVRSDHIDLLATVSLEEVLVASTLIGEKNRAGQEALRNHGDYLLAHLHVSADGQPVAGNVLEVPRQTTGQLAYRIEYRLPGRAGSARWPAGHPARWACSGP